MFVTSFVPLLARQNGGKFYEVSAMNATRVIYYCPKKLPLPAPRSPLPTGRPRNLRNKSRQSRELIGRANLSSSPLLEFIHRSLCWPNHTTFKISENANIHLPEADYATHKLIIKHAYAHE
jgi:hypothetical protein